MTLPLHRQIKPFTTNLGPVRTLSGPFYSVVWPFTPCPLRSGGRARGWCTPALERPIA